MLDFAKVRKQDLNNKNATDAQVIALLTVLLHVNLETGESFTGMETMANLSGIHGKKFRQYLKFWEAQEVLSIEDRILTSPKIKVLVGMDDDNKFGVIPKEVILDVNFDLGTRRLWAQLLSDFYRRKREVSLNFSSNLSFKSIDKLCEKYSVNYRSFTKRVKKLEEGNKMKIDKKNNVIKMMPVDKVNEEVLKQNSTEHLANKELKTPVIAIVKLQKQIDEKTAYLVDKHKQGRLTQARFKEVKEQIKEVVSKLQTYRNTRCSAEVAAKVTEFLNKVLEILKKIKVELNMLDYEMMAKKTTKKHVEKVVDINAAR